MKKKSPLCPQTILGLAGAAFITLLGSQPSAAFEDYSGCSACHGDFRGPTSTKGTVFPSNNNHEMHRNAANMATACNLCHTGDSNSRVPTFIKTSNGTANNAGVGCTGCHEPAGLRKHHKLNGTDCYECHDPLETPLTENTKPPYYGTADTKVKNPANTVLTANTNENWSVGDSLGLDNDGNNLYDLADYAVGPYQLLNVTREGNNIRVTWLTAGGRTNTVQAAGTVAGTFANVSSPITISGVGLATNNYVEVGGATNLTRFYRMNAVVP